MSQSTHGDSHEHQEGHISPLKTYFGVFGALVFLTVVTVAISYMNLGPRALIVAIAVAMVKAGLVIGYFMHLKYEARFYSLVFFGSLIFLSFFFVFTFLDLGSRDRVNAEHETFAFVKVKKLQELADSPAGKSVPADKEPGATRPEAAPKVDLPAPPAVPGGAQGGLDSLLAPGAPGAAPPLDEKAIQELQKQLVEALKKEFQKMKEQGPGGAPGAAPVPAPAPAPAPAHP